jgi:hypothetical protein
MTMMRCLLAVALLAAAAGCGGHKTDTTTTTTSTTTSAPAAATAAPAPAGTMSVQVTGGTTSGGSAAPVAGQPPGFDTEAAAQARCASDQVVWLNTKTHVYHEKGMLYYGHTKKGAYVCRKEADAAGDHDTKNGK